MRRLTLIILILASAATSAFSAGNKMVTGKIIGMNGEPLVGATITLKDGDKLVGGIASDIEGKYALAFSQTGSASLALRISSIGYEDTLWRFYPAQNTVEANFTLVEKPIDFGTVVVSPQRHPINLLTTMNSEQVDLAAHRSLISTNPTSAIRQAQVIREGSSLSSKLRINGTSPTYYINGAEIGYDPNHYSMFSIVPASMVDHIKFFPQGTNAASGSPSTIEFNTPQPFNSKLHSEIDLSFIEGTGSMAMGSKRFFVLSSIRKSVLDKLADKITPDSKQKSIPPTNFRDIFISAGFKASNRLRFLLDSYDVKDYLSYNLGATSNNPGGINTVQDTGERFLGIRLESFSKHLSFKLGGAIKESREFYHALSVGSQTPSAYLVDLGAKSRTNLANLEINLLSGKTSVTAGDNLNYVQDHQISLHQNNWNFLPPDANSDNPFIYQKELNRYYGSYNSLDDQLTNASYITINQPMGALEFESGVRNEYFRDLSVKNALLWRNSVVLKSQGFGVWGISYGKYANSPINRILEPYQVLVQANISHLRPVQTDLFAISWTLGPLKLGAFNKSISYLPRITPDFSQVDANNVAGKNFLAMSSDGQINSSGADITLELSDLRGFDFYTYYGFSHADKITKDISVPYELNASHKFFAQTEYKLSRHFRIGSSFSLHTGFPYTQSSTMGNILSTGKYTEDYYRQEISTENSARFPLNITSDVFMDFAFGNCKIYATVSNVYNHRNPIISTADGFVYDAGILPSLGLKYKF